MLNILWSFLVIFSLVVSVFTGRISETVSGAIDGASESVNMCMGLLGVMCMWNGIMNIAEKSGLTGKMTKIVKPIFTLLFKEIPSESPAGETVITNLTANLLGMGNAATPAGIKAMKEMAKMGKTARKDMALFTVLNTASFQLLPTTLMALRTSAGSVNPAEIILPVWCASACSVAMAILCAKTICR